MIVDPPNERDRFDRYLREVVAATLACGMTASKINTYEFLQPIDAWGFPKYPSKTVILPPEVDLIKALETFVNTNRIPLSEADAWLGTWIDPRTHQCYLDITTSHKNLEEARRLATEISLQEGRQIVALYNSLREETVYL